MLDMVILLLCLFFPLKGLALPSNAMRQIVDQIQPRSLIYLGSDIGDSFNIVDVYNESMTAQLIDDWNFGKELVKQDMPPKSMLVVPVQDPKMLADLWSSSNQHNFIHTTWIIIGSSLSILKQAVMFHIDVNGNGFSPMTTMFFMEDKCESNVNSRCFVTQIIGNGLKPPVFKVISPKYKNQFIVIIINYYPGLWYVSTWT